MEIIVVDNASSDGSPEMVAGEFPSVRLIHSGGNLGFAKANNIGMRVSRGRYLGLVNSDVEVLDDCLSQLIQRMESHPRIWQHSLTKSPTTCLNRIRRALT